MFLFREKTKMIEPDRALPGRETAMPVPASHDVLGTPLQPPFFRRDSRRSGCFWGARAAVLAGPASTRRRSATPAATRRTPPTRRSAAGRTGHTEAVLVVFDPDEGLARRAAAHFWEGHDPTQGMRQGNDVGTQYRSAIYWVRPNRSRRAPHSTTRDMFQEEPLASAGYGEITTEIADAPEFYYAEDYHQQYLAKNPERLLRPLGLTGVFCAAAPPPRPPTGC